MDSYPILKQFKKNQKWWLYIYIYWYLKIDNLLGWKIDHPGRLLDFWKFNTRWLLKNQELTRKSLINNQLDNWFKTQSPANIGYD
jgi:hypothetical protein